MQQVRKTFPGGWKIVCPLSCIKCSKSARLSFDISLPVILPKIINGHSSNISPSFGWYLFSSSEDNILIYGKLVSDLRQGSLDFWQDSLDLQHGGLDFWHVRKIIINVALSAVLELTDPRALKSRLMLCLKRSKKI